MRFIRNLAGLGILLVTISVPTVAPVQLELKAIAQTADDLRTQQITAAIYLKQLGRKQIPIFSKL